MKTLQFMLAGLTLSLSASASPAFADQYVCEAELITQYGTTSLGSLSVDPDKSITERLPLDGNDKVFLSCGGTGPLSSSAPLESAAMCGFTVSGQTLGWTPTARGLPHVVVKSPRGAVPHPDFVSTIVAKGTSMFALQVSYPKQAGDIVVACSLKD